MPITLTRAQAVAFDRKAADEYGLPTLVLMENAGRGAAELLMRLNPDRQPVLVLCGPGNNGGDGFVLARHLDAAGWPVAAWLVRPEATRAFGFGAAVAAADRRVSPDCGVNLTVWGHDHPILTNDPADPHWRESLVAAVAGSKWVVDALFGTGLRGELPSPYAELAGLLRNVGVDVLALDVPSGLDADTGTPTPGTIRATHTATFVAPKAGFANPAAADFLGTVHVLPVGAPRGLVAGLLGEPVASAAGVGSSGR